MTQTDRDVVLADRNRVLADRDVVLAFIAAMDHGDAKARARCPDPQAR
ncbi:MAG: hypothetical protein P8Y58_07510 [Novosphingobium sp.]